MATERMLRVSSKGQIVLPKRLREKTGIIEGDYVVAREIGGGVFIIKNQPETWLESITKELRDEVAAEGFTREDLDALIHDIRKKRATK
jgi:AbrB family looped-hinge helix DNA binding protein